MASSGPNFQVLSFQGAEGQSKLQSRRYQKRKSHAKSKAGCASCKIKRVKCDEDKPSCGRCRRTSCPCIYTSVLDSVVSCSVEAGDNPRGDSSSRGSSHSLMQPSLPIGINLPSTPYGTPRMVLLQHFNNVFTELSIFGAPESSPVIALGLSRPYLLDAVLAVSASHLRIHTCAPSTHRVAEHFQQSLALRNFQSALAEPLDAQGADALLLTGMLLNLLIFSITEDDEPASSWVFSKRPGRLNWLSLLLGYKPLLLATSPFHANTTLLRWMFEASDDEHRTFNGGPWSLEDVPSHWLELCGLNVKTSAEEHILYEPVRILAELRKYEPREGSFFIYQSFVGKLDGRFRDLLEASDYRAMWLLGYWMGLLRRFDIWWMRQLVSRDHRAVLSWLNQQGLKERGGREGQMWAELLLDLELAPVWLEDCRVQEV